MDRNFLLRRHQLSLMAAEQTISVRGRHAHEQCARNYADQIHFVRAALGAGSASLGSVT